jgi:hypothetical protein
MRPPFPQRLAAAWRALCGAAPATAPPPAAPADDACLAAQAEAARQRLAAEEAAAQVAALRRELDAERQGRAQAVAASLQARLEPALADAALFRGQLALQAHLLEQGKPVAARDVLALAGGLARAWEKLGLTLLAQPGAAAAFDPAQHQPVEGFTPAPGAPVAITIPGCRLGERILRKSFVTAAA